MADKQAECVQHTMQPTPRPCQAASTQHLQGCELGIPDAGRAHHVEAAASRTFAAFAGHGAAAIASSSSSSNPGGLAGMVHTAFGKVNDRSFSVPMAAVPVSGNSVDPNTMAGMGPSAFGMVDSGRLFAPMAAVPVSGNSFKFSVLADNPSALGMLGGSGLFAPMAAVPVSGNSFNISVRAGRNPSALGMLGGSGFFAPMAAVQGSDSASSSNSGNTSYDDGYIWDFAGTRSRTDRLGTYLEFACWRQPGGCPAKKHVHQQPDGQYRVEYVNKHNHAVPDQDEKMQLFNRVAAVQVSGSAGSSSNSSLSVCRSNMTSYDDEYIWDFARTRTDRLGSCKEFVCWRRPGGCPATKFVYQQPNGKYFLNYIDNHSHAVPTKGEKLEFLHRAAAARSKVVVSSSTSGVDSHLVTTSAIRDSQPVRLLNRAAAAAAAANSGAAVPCTSADVFACMMQSMNIDPNSVTGDTRQGCDQRIDEARFGWRSSEHQRNQQKQRHQK